MITIVDYGMGNLGSVANMLKRIGALVTISSNPIEIAAATKLLLPGVGAFDNAMTQLNESGMREVLDHKVTVARVPILGICLGMQLFTRSSEEGKLPGLGWVMATTRRFPAAPNLKVPHMGWNKVKAARESALTQNLPADARFYFVHSYCVFVDSQENSILKTTYGINFDAAIQKDNIYGVQFHPEKSHKFGFQLLQNFVNL